MTRRRPPKRPAPATAAADLERRVGVQLRLALAAIAPGGDDAGLDAAARSAGLTGAEIDAARAGRSFEARTGALIGVARALGSGDATALAAARAHAARIGLTSGELEVVAAEVAAILRGAR